MKKLSILAILVVTALVVAACGGTAQEYPLEAQNSMTVVSTEVADPIELEVPANPAAPQTFDTQSSDAGRVVIDITPVTLGGDHWDFEIDFNTHSVNLGFDPTTISVLRCDRGQEFEPVAWDGSGPGGHHRSGLLRFTALDHPTEFVEIAVRDVAGVPERVFRWEIPYVESYLDGVEPYAAGAGSAKPEPDPREV